MRKEIQRDIQITREKKDTNWKREMYKEERRKRANDIEGNWKDRERAKKREGEDKESVTKEIETWKTRRETENKQKTER